MQCGVVSKIPHDNVSFSITAEDLSEDMSKLSTGEDELVLLLYDYQEELQNPIIKEVLLVERDFKANYTFHFKQKEYILFLIEMDTERSLKPIESIVRIHAKNLIEAHDQNKREVLQEILDTDDFLGYHFITKRREKFTIEGRRIMDRYAYKFKLSPIRPNR